MPSERVRLGYITGHAGNKREIALMQAINSYLIKHGVIPCRSRRYQASVPSRRVRLGFKAGHGGNRYGN
ncbi:hypothetical protein NDU88_006984 [Pleurodeles waltl]|uniref:Uncharacterized protein n=1 Tax=Pleurodeles waltl TaxID=8319 RepID=A0AAV7RQC7_PLEWA|nr:hypothetical protein NDU88_006984 [Pleurodeles waltl]